MTTPMLPLFNQLCVALQALVGGQGAELDDILRQPELLALECVRTEGVAPGERITTDEGVLASKVRLVLERECTSLQAPLSIAALYLFGITARLQSTKIRRHLAGWAMGLTEINEIKDIRKTDNTWDNFRKRYEKKLIKMVAWRLYDLELQTREREQREVIPGSGETTGELPLISVTEKAELEAIAEEARDYVRVGVALTYRVFGQDLRLHTYTRAYTIEAVQPGMRQFRYWYQWSGHGREKPPIVVSRGHRSVGVPTRSGGWTYCDIQFDHELDVGERTTIKIEQELYDSDQEFGSFLSATVHDDAYEWLALRVILPTTRLPHEIMRKVFVSNSPGAPLAEPSVPGSYEIDPELDAAIIKWEPPNPRHHWRYVVDWKYADGESLYPPDSTKGA